MFCLHARARVGDVLRASEEPVLDIAQNAKSGLIDLGLARHKTMGFQVTKRKLPLVGLAFGVSGRDGATPWMKAREALGFSAPTDGCFLRTPSPRPFQSS